MFCLVHEAINIIFMFKIISRESDEYFEDHVSVCCPAGAGPGVGPGSVKSHPQFHMNAAPQMSQSVENMHQMKKLMEQELKSDKFKSNSNNKGYVFTLMPIYAIGVGLFAAYKFLKVVIFVVVIHITHVQHCNQCIITGFIIRTKTTSLLLGSCLRCLCVFADKVCK